MNRIEQDTAYNDPNRPFAIRYTYRIDLNMDLNDVPEKYRDDVFDMILSDFKLELKSKIYKIDKLILLK